ncbi:hypothetical protein PG991_013521 [Apiospora marii]|uniref:Uncharacterized protein n=1 Tax=Apiospora marii TaxID=335849 RepID=A0ABR1R684_9PEZI
MPHYPPSAQKKRKAGDVPEDPPCNKKTKMGTVIRLLTKNGDASPGSVSQSKLPGPSGIAARPPLARTTPIPELPGGKLMQSALKVFYHGLGIVPRQVRWLDLSDAQTPRQALVDVLQATMYLHEDVLIMIQEILATPAKGYPSACFVRALAATYQDEEMRRMGLGFYGSDLPRKWKTAGAAGGKDYTTLTLQVFRWLLDISQYTLTVTHIVDALLCSPSFQGEPALQKSATLPLHVELWDGYRHLDKRIEKIRQEANIPEAWNRLFRPTFHGLTQGELGHALSAYKFSGGVSDMREAIVVHGWRSVDVWKLDLGRNGTRPRPIIWHNAAWLHGEHWPR